MLFSNFCLKKCLKNQNHNLLRLNLSLKKQEILAHYINHLPSRTITLDHKEYLFFSGTSYFGIGHNELFRSSLMENRHNYGTIFSASRNNTIQLDIYREVEEFLAQDNGAEAALTVSSGMLAGQLVVRLLENLPFIYEPSCHPALWKEASLPNIFENHKDFCSQIADHVRAIAGPCVVCTNGVDPLTCEAYNFDWVMDLDADHPIYVIIDDSHVLGLLYPNSLAGNYSKIKPFCPPNVQLIVTASMAKALSLPAGVILGSQTLIDKIASLSHFIGASPSVPAYFKSFLQCQKEYLDQKLLLSDNIQTFKKQIAPVLSQFKYLPDYPIFYYPDAYLYEALLQKDIFISCFAYPNPGDPPICRIVLSALHTQEDIQSLGKAIAEAVHQEK